MAHLIRICNGGNTIDAILETEDFQRWGIGRDKPEALKMLLKGLADNFPEYIIEGYLGIGKDSEAIKYAQSMGDKKRALNIFVYLKRDDYARLIVKSDTSLESTLRSMIDRRNSEDFEASERNRLEREKFEQAMELYKTNPKAAIRMLGYYPGDT